MWGLSRSEDELIVDQIFWTMLFSAFLKIQRRYAYKRILLLSQSHKYTGLEDSNETMPRGTEAHVPESCAVQNWACLLARFSVHLEALYASVDDCRERWPKVQGFKCYMTCNQIDQQVSPTPPSLLHLIPKENISLKRQKPCSRSGHPTAALHELGGVQPPIWSGPQEPLVVGKERLGDGARVSELLCLLQGTT